MTKDERARRLPQGGKVTLDGEFMRAGISVADTGSGIPEDAPVSISERFSQASGNDGGGLGLGLYISRYLIEALGGSIRAERYTGAGSTIHLMIPA